MTAKTRVLFALLGMLGACHSLLEVDSPLRIPATNLNDPTLAPQLVASAIGDFECAFGDYVSDVAQITDEFYGTASLAANMPVALRRTAGFLDPLSIPGCSQVANGPTAQIYAPLSAQTRPQNQIGQPAT